MDRIEALKHVLQDNGFSEEKKQSARASLQDIATNASTAHERQTASHLLQSLAAKESAVDAIPICDEMLRLLFLGKDTSDTPENNQRAREMYRRQIETSSE